MKQTVLNAAHRQRGAALVEFAGWEMPLSYSSIIAEVQAVRQAAGLFDVSHMGVIELRGEMARADADRLVTCALQNLAPGRARYGLLLNPNGGILDDLLIYSLAADRLWIIANAANAEQDARWMEARLSPGTRLQRHFGQIAILALQGPRALEIAATATGRDYSGLRRFGFQTWEREDALALASRSGYTGEDGLEFFCSVEQAPALWERLLATGEALGLQPCGLGARDVLRIEAGNVLYGHEIREDTNPVEAGLFWAVSLEKGEFVGREAVQQVLAQPLTRQIAGLVMEERAIPRQGMAVGSDGEATGVITSGTFSPTLGKAIAMGYLPPALQPGMSAWVAVRDRQRRASITALPFYRRH